MSLRSPFAPRTTLTRLAIAAASGTLIALTAITPAGAAITTADDRNDGWNNNSSSSRYDDWGRHGNHNPRLYKGRVTARGGLILRAAPNRGAQVIRVAPYGEIVSIFCKTSGQKVDKNPLWYLLTDGTWAWGAARYIDNIGPAPRWC